LNREKGGKRNLKSRRNKKREQSVQKREKIE